jgi:unsaturated chondroitin disaccharide hydrolase
MNTDATLRLKQLEKDIDRFWQLSGEKIMRIEHNVDPSKGAPVFTINGKYTARGWTEWTQGFQFGSALLQFDATGESSFLTIGKKNTLEKMAPHLTHQGVHDHGFNNISTYGNLLRLMAEGKTPFNEWEKAYYQLALKISGAVQAMRWTPITDGGFMYSFNGPHSLFVDTVRSCRILMLSHSLGHILMGENDRRIDLFLRAVQHLEATARYAVFYGEGRDHYDQWGRTAHESIFNIHDGNYRCPNSQQGFSGFTTWTRGLAWAMCGFAEQLEFLDALPIDSPGMLDRKNDLTALFAKAARATCDFYIRHSTLDGIPFWDTGAPGLAKLGDYYNVTSDPYNEFEPVDSSAAAIAAQGFLRLGTYLQGRGDGDGEHYQQAGLFVARTLLQEPYLSTKPEHEGLILHSVYHRPNGWDHIPEGRKIPCGESSMWGDYHARELVLYLTKLIRKEPYYTFFAGII